MYKYDYLIIFFFTIQIKYVTIKIQIYKALLPYLFILYIFLTTQKLIQ